MKKLNDQKIELVLQEKTQAIAQLKLQHEAELKKYVSRIAKMEEEFKEELEGVKKDSKDDLISSICGKVDLADYLKSGITAYSESLSHVSF